MNKLEKLSRYQQIVSFLIKYGRSDIVEVAELEVAELEIDREQAERGDPSQLADDLEAMGPTFVKAGQFLSTRSDLISPPYLEALTRLQDHVDPFDSNEVERIVEEELNVRLSKAFEEFEYIPVASASLGQVHRAKLRDGRPVVVKIQRPGIREQILKDLEVLGEIVNLIDKHTPVGRHYPVGDMFNTFRRSLLRELNYNREANNLIRLGEDLAAYDDINVPQPILSY
jgi:predicted unusual protein kinase regulating ubiquinone biosynthesis (AarF/ABC1/UbiB family)